MKDGIMKRIEGSVEKGWQEKRKGEGKVRGEKGRGREKEEKRKRRFLE